MSNLSATAYDRVYKSFEKTAQNADARARYMFLQEYYLNDDDSYAIDVITDIYGLNEETIDDFCECQFGYSFEQLYPLYMLETYFN